ncbi:hypothetical protein [Anaerococcus cruorum]|uniref:Uncharacterized protein n=1 Tax=Anaerococcus cruorum TaxID=3115617 RepID=A0ABW9MU37_9FIRM
MMFNKRNKNSKSKYKSFEEWANDTLKKLEEMEEENQEKNKKTTYESKKKPTVFRKFSDNKDVDEKFPRPESKKQSQMDKRSHEGKVNTRGSIKGNPAMGREGDPINPDLRRRLEEKKRRELRESRKKKEYKNDVHYKRKNEKNAEKHAKVASYKSTLKNKESFRKAILMSEILAPPLAKRKKF